MKSLKTISLGAVLLIAFSLSFYKNVLFAAPPVFFDDYQHNSESLVIARLAAVENKIEWPSGSHLGFLSVSEFVYEPKYIYQSYHLLQNKILPPISLKAAAITDQKWSLGIAKNFAGVVTKVDPRLEDYVGRQVTLLGTTRLIKAVDSSGEYSTIYLIGAPVPSPVGHSRDIELTISGGQASKDDLAITPYMSQFGIQGQFFLSLFQMTGHKLARLYIINSVIFAAVLVWLSLLYSRTLPRQFVFFFVGVTLLSPWVTAFGKNLYWVPFTWYLPAVFSLLYMRGKTRSAKWIYAPLLYIAFIIKCLAGYEYISSVILFAAAPFLYFAIMEPTRAQRIWYAKKFLVICFIGVAGFFTALLMHADLRGPTIWEGLRVIYEGDIKRRTYGDPSKFVGENMAALSSSPLDVLKIYVLDWHTQLVKAIPGTMFRVVTLGSLGVVVYRFFYLKTRNMSDLAMLVAFILPPVSWFVLAKGHAFIHTQLNFVLWYLGFIPATFHVCFNGLKLLVVRTFNWARTARIDAI